MERNSQMDLFDEGGLIDEGNTNDPVSGNDTPVGSLNEEVRDDIPAQLSEGEFVLPADVVRYHGLEKIMNLRDEAKMGLQKMEDMGQMGNADEAILSDDVPFSMDDLELEDDPVEMQAGGFTAGQTLKSNVAPQFQQQPILRPQPITQPPFMPTPFPPQQPSLMPTQAGVPTMDPGSVPKFEDFIKAGEGTAPENREYINPETGEKRFFTFIGGKSTVEIPDGFIPISQYKPEEKKPAVQPTAAPVQQQESDRETDAERKDRVARETRIRERKAAAKELGYTKEADPLKEAGKFLLGALIPGGGLLMGMDKPEKGTIMPDGSISDGEGNTFDPRTGEQLGGKGFLGFGKSVGEEYGMEGAAIPESSIAGLRSLAGEDSIKDLLASLPDEVKVASTTAAGAGKTVGEAAAETTKPTIPGDPFSDPRKAGQSIDRTVGRTGAEKAAGAGTFKSPQKDTRISPGAMGGRIEPQKDADKTQADLMESAQAAAERRQKEREAAAEKARQERARKAETARLEAQAKKAREAEIRKQDELRKRAEDSEKAKAAAQAKRENKHGFSDKRVRDNQGTATKVNEDSGQIFYDKDHDWSKPTQTNVNSRPPKQESDGGGGGGGGRWCCSAMVHQGVWSHKGEFARLTVWSMKQPDWWRSGYDVWGKVLAKTFLRKKGFWTDIMQSFYDYHIRNKPFTWKTALAHVMVYPGAFICGHIWTKVPKTARLAKLEELK